MPAKRPAMSLPVLEVKVLGWPSGEVASMFQLYCSKKSFKLCPVFRNRVSYSSFGQQSRAIQGCGNNLCNFWNLLDYPG